LVGWGAIESPVKSYVRKDANGNDIVINVTQPGHPLHPGYVIRHVEVHGDQSIIHNDGEGLGLLQAPISPFRSTINDQWIDQSKQIINRVSKPGGQQ